jgi:putative Mg2+ transporter-C (MgtC) family protein
MPSEVELLWRLGLALVLSAIIGLEREVRQKSAGARTYALVGLGAALFMLISKYGFNDLVGVRSISLDPSRVAAQIVSGVGFLGAGLIIVRRDSVRGLTTAAGIWLTAAVGAAAGASLWLLAIATTVAYFLVMFGLTPIARRLPGAADGSSAIHLVYEDGRGVLRRILSLCTSRDFKVADVLVRRRDGLDHGPISVSLEVHGRGPVPALAGALGEIDGVLEVSTGEVDEYFE